jgi:hypothetical protein
MSMLLSNDTSWPPAIPDGEKKSFGLGARASEAMRIPCQFLLLAER